MNKWILRLADVDLADIPRVGGKGANLGHLLRAGLPVPNGYCITTDAYDLAAATQFRELPAELWDAIQAAHRDLSGPVAVRSSATAEDLAGASFAGQQETLLDVAGDERLQQAILRCFASLWSARATQYRERMGFCDQADKLCVVVQAMVPARVAGVMFTAHPVSGDARVCVIEAAVGLGENVVSGMAPVDQFVADKASGRITGLTVPKGAAPVLTPAEVAELVAYGRRIEALYGVPQDIEWAYDGDRVRILQARPITTLGGRTGSMLQRPRPQLTRNQVRMIRQLAERFSEAIRPYDADVSGRGVIRGLQRLARWLGVIMPFAPESIYLMQDGVPVAICPQAKARPRLTIGLVAGIPRAIRAVCAADPAEWQRREYPALHTQISALEQQAAGAGHLSEETLLRFIDRAAEHGSDAFYSRRRYMLTLVLPAVLKRRIARLFPADADRVYADLMAGIDHTTARLNRALFTLAGEAAADPLVRSALDAADPAEHLRDTLFLTHFAAFLAEFGSREITQGGASWGEEPQVVWSALRSLVGRPAPSESPHRYQGALKQCLAALPGWRKSRFVRLVNRARAAEAMREDSHFMICRSIPVSRAFALELGRRFAQRGLVARADDVLFLLRSEIDAAVAGATEGMQERVARRRALYEAVRAEGLVPPDWLPPVKDAQHLRGTPASKGIAEGPARLIRSQAEFHKLQPGEVLVCRYTNPAWTPLFHLAAAVVAETGGAASHAAIVAREFGVPAVMGVQQALTLIRDGQRLRVDGRSGEVHML